MSNCRVVVGLLFALTLRPGLALAQPAATPPYFVDQTMSNGDTYHLLFGWFTSTFIIDRETSCAPPAILISPPSFSLADNRAVGVAIPLQVSLQLPIYAAVDPPNPWWRIGYPILSSIDDPCTNRNDQGQSVNPEVWMAYSTHFDAPEAGISQVIGCQSWIGSSYADAHIPPATYQLRYSSPGRKTASVTYYFCHNGAETGDIAGQGTLTFTVSGPTLRVRASIDGVAFVPAQGAALPAMVHVPLGAALDLKVTDQDGRDLPASFSLNTASVAPGVAATAIFRDKVLARMAVPGVNTAEYVAFHRGTVIVAIAPADASAAAGALTVSVEDPKRLGTTGNGVDQDVYNAAHRYGVLPQFVKAHAHKESGASFNRTAYRYEPLGPWAGDLLRVSRADNLRVRDPYSRFRLATAPDQLNGELAAGDSLADPDWGDRRVLLIECDANGRNGRPIEPADPPVSAQEIFKCNDRTMHWTQKAGDAGPSRAQSLMKDSFTAQTGLAASFGLLQMTYVGAIRDVQWKGDKDGRLNPGLLYDTADVIARLAGSLEIGTFKVQKDFKNVAPESTIGTVEALLLAMVRAWHRYNPGEPNYGGSVAVRVPFFFPQAAVPVFGGGQ